MKAHQSYDDRKGRVGIDFLTFFLVNLLQGEQLPTGFTLLKNV